MIHTKNFTEKLFEWYEENGRDFFWRTEDLTPFQVLIVEMCLKRTKPKKVDRVGKKIIETIPNLPALSNVGKSELKKLLEPLGLQENRTEELKGIADALESKYEGKIPQDRETLLSIEGIGPYVSDAVLCFGFGHFVVVVDPNVAEVGKKYFGVSVDGRSGEYPELKRTIHPYIPDGRVEEFNWALIDLGTEIKRKKREGKDFENHLNF